MNPLAAARYAAAAEARLKWEIDCLRRSDDADEHFELLDDVHHLEHIFSALSSRACQLEAAIVHAAYDPGRVVCLRAMLEDARASLWDAGMEVEEAIGNLHGYSRAVFGAEVELLRWRSTLAVIQNTYARAGVLGNEMLLAQATTSFTDLLDADTGADSLSDGDNPLSSNSGDSGGLTDTFEVDSGFTLLSVVDTDADGLADYDEVGVCSDPASNDTVDGDGHDVSIGSDPAYADSDNEGILDGFKDADTNGIVDAETDSANTNTDGHFEIGDNFLDIVGRARNGNEEAKNALANYARSMKSSQRGAEFHERLAVTFSELSGESVESVADRIPIIEDVVLFAVKGIKNLIYGSHPICTVEEFVRKLDDAAHYLGENGRTSNLLMEACYRLLHEAAQLEAEGANGNTRFSDLMDNLGDLADLARERKILTPVAAYQAVHAVPLDVLRPVRAPGKADEHDSLDSAKSVRGQLSDGVKKVLVDFLNDRALLVEPFRDDFVADNAKVLDGLASLLDGDEVCAAVCVNSGTVYVATNSADHRGKGDVLATIQTFLPEDAEPKWLSEVVLRTRVLFEHTLDTSRLADVVKEGPDCTYDWDANMGYYILRDATPFTIKTEVMIPARSGTVVTDVEVDVVPAKFMHLKPRTLAVLLRSGFAFELRPLGGTTDALTRRSDLLFQYVRSLRHGGDADLRGKVLVESLASTLGSLCVGKKESFDVHNFSDLGRNLRAALEPFVAKFLGDFETGTLDGLVEALSRADWSSLEAFGGKLRTRHHVFTDKTRLHVAVERAFRALLKVEARLIAGRGKGDPVFDALFNHDHVEVVDVGGDDVHAEMKIFLTLGADISPYIGISRLSCPFCHRVCNAVNWPHRGTHAFASGWGLSRDLREHKPFMTAILGASTMKKFVILKDSEKATVLSMLRQCGSWKNAADEYLGFEGLIEWQGLTNDYPDSDEGDVIVTVGLE